MEHRDFHWHWWHWLLIILAIMLTVGVTYTLVNNYEIVKNNDNNRYYMTETSFNTFIEAINYIIK